MDKHQLWQGVEQAERLEYAWPSAQCLDGAHCSLVLPPPDGAYAAHLHGPFFARATDPNCRFTRGEFLEFFVRAVVHDDTPPTAASDLVDGFCGDVVAHLAAQPDADLILQRPDVFRLKHCCTPPPIEEGTRWLYHWPDAHVGWTRP